jgi:hypothetical protein
MTTGGNGQSGTAPPSPDTQVFMGSGLACGDPE